jgi:hypothetical protein
MIGRALDIIERTAITAGAVGLVAAVLLVTCTPLGEMWDLCRSR